MNHNIQDFLDRIVAISPITSEAYPTGLVGKVPGMKPLIEVAWQTMEVACFAAGTIFGVVMTVVFFAAIAFRTALPNIMKAVANASHP